MIFSAETSLNVLSQICVSVIHFQMSTSTVFCSDELLIHSFNINSPSVWSLVSAASLSAAMSNSFSPSVTLDLSSYCLHQSPNQDKDLTLTVGLGTGGNRGR